MAGINRCLTSLQYHPNQGFQTLDPGVHCIFLKKLCKMLILMLILIILLESKLISSCYFMVKISTGHIENSGGGLYELFELAG